MSAARLMFARSARAWASAAAIVAFGGAAAAAQFHSTTDVAVLYDAPSAKARPLFVLAKDTPLELIVTVEGWMKIRDVGGTVAWVDRKVVGDKRMLVVRAPMADVLARVTWTPMKSGIQTMSVKAIATRNPVGTFPDR